jgi:hypothetical protein
LLMKTVHDRMSKRSEPFTKDLQISPKVKNNTNAKIRRVKTSKHNIIQMKHVFWVSNYSFMNNNTMDNQSILFIDHTQQLMFNINMVSQN